MKPLPHIILGFAFAFFLYLFFPHVMILEASIIFLSSFLIDIDHYLYHFYKDKTFNLKKIYKILVKKIEEYRRLSGEEKQKYYSGYYFLHGLEVLIILLFLGYFISELFLYIFVGFTFHLLLDMVHQTYFHKRLDKFSLIRDFYKFKKLKRLTIE